MQKKVLFVRMDKIGDLVLSLGVDQHPKLDSYDVEWLVSEDLKALMEAASPKRKYFCWKKKPSFKNFWSYLRFLREQSFDTVVYFQGPSWLFLLFFLAGIPNRVGPKSKFLSRLLLNQGLKQKRSDSIRNEFHYNQDLVEKAFHLPCAYLEPTKLIAPPISVLPNLSNYVLVHAGMGGSALNWPEEKYIELIDSCLNRKCNVLITGTDSDRVYLQKILKRYWPEKKEEENFVHPNSSYVMNLVGRLNFAELLNVLSRAKGVVAPSTGVLHLAAALGAKTLGVYPPIRVQSPVRWGALGKDVHIFSPKIECPERYKCRGESCQYFYCMDRILVEDVLGVIFNDSNGI